MDKWAVSYINDLLDDLETLILYWRTNGLIEVADELQTIYDTYANEKLIQEISTKKWSDKIREELEK